MSKNNHSILSDMKKAKGLGSAHSGTHHWLMQRVTAIANIPLIFWAVYAVFKLQGASHADFVTFFTSPMNAVLAILFILNSFYHAVLGNQVIVEDYIHCQCFKMMKLIGMKLFFVALGVATIFSILKMAFMSGM